MAIDPVPPAWQLTPPADGFGRSAAPDPLPPITGVRFATATKAKQRRAASAYMPRKAVATGRLAARSAGNKPPRIPVATAQSTPSVISEGFTTNV